MWCRYSMWTVCWSRLPKANKAPKLLLTKRSGTSNVNMSEYSAEHNKSA